MTTDALQKAVRECLRREAEQMAKVEGADHQRILDDVAREYGIEIDTLTEAFLDADLHGAI